MNPLRASTISLIVALALSACGAEARPYGSVDEIVRALDGESIRCVGVADRPNARLVDGNATCSIDGRQVTIMTFRGERGRDRWLQFGELYGGELVVGPNWVLRSENARTADRMAEALDAERPDLEEAR